MKRRRLPNRRDNLTVTFQHEGRSYAATLGVDRVSGQALEVFAHGAKVGSAIDGICDDACIALSLLLQHGVNPAALAASMGRLGDGQTPASIIGRLTDLLAAEAGRGSA